MLAPLQPMENAYIRITAIFVKNSTRVGIKMIVKIYSNLSFVEIRGKLTSYTFNGAAYVRSGRVYQSESGDIHTAVFVRLQIDGM